MVAETREAFYTDTTLHDDKNLVVVAFTGDAPGVQKELTGEVVGVGRR
jgi:hypothetical protein